MRDERRAATHQDIWHADLEQMACDLGKQITKCTKNQGAFDGASSQFQEEINLALYAK